MDFTLEVDNRNVTLRGPGVARRAIMAELDRITSYKIAGSHFAPSYKKRKSNGERVWDGKEHLLKMHAATGRFRFPTGLLEDIQEALAGAGCTFNVEEARTTRPPRDWPWNPAVVMRDYQEDAVEALAQAPVRGCGILKIAIRGGKTKTAARAVWRLKPASVLFIVPSTLLLHQSRADIAEAFGVPVEEIGIIGEGIWEERPFTVAMIHTLANARGGWREVSEPAVECRMEKIGGKLVRVEFCPLQKKDGKRKGARLVPVTTKTRRKFPQDTRYTELMRNTDMALFDECHHLKAETWHGVMMDLDARYKLGLSATVDLANEAENEKGAIWLKACCGPVRVDISMSDLIEHGSLMAPTFWLVECREPHGVDDAEWSQELRDVCIYENSARNSLIMTAAEKLVRGEGMKTLVVTNRHNHIAILQQGLEWLGLKVSVVIGGMKRPIREERIKAFVDGETDVLLGTVFGEGVNIPVIEGVIVGEGGADAKAAVQRLRNLTKIEGKKAPIVVDFMDLMHPDFARHSLERLETYRAERAFRFVRKRSL